MGFDGFEEIDQNMWIVKIILMSNIAFLFVVLLS